VVAKAGPIVKDIGRCPPTASTTFAESTDCDVVLSGGSLFDIEPR
jgi:hypothetical protein